MWPVNRHLTFANLASALALTVALGTGGAWAATQLPKNSVTSKTIKNSAITSKDVKNGSLKAADFATGQLPAGPAGAPAVSLFAAVVDSGNANAATLGTNKGA